MIYISGPLTDVDPAIQAGNIEYALFNYKQLVLARCLVYCPHLSALLPGAFDMPYQLWLNQDLAIIERGHISSLLLLVNWENSNGAKQELQLALRMRLPIFTRRSAVVDHYHTTYGLLPQ